MTSRTASRFEVDAAKAAPHRLAPEAVERRAVDVLCLRPRVDLTTLRAPMRRRPADTSTANTRAAASADPPAVVR